MKYAREFLTNAVVGGLLGRAIRERVETSLFDRLPVAPSDGASTARAASP